MSRKSRRKHKGKVTTPPTPTAPPKDTTPAVKARRPVGFNAETCREVVNGVRAGLPYKHAAERAGLAERTLYNWLTKGQQEEDGPYRQFMQDIKEAAAEFVESCVGHIKAACVDSWQAAAWLMERKHPDQFAAERVRLKALETQVADLLTRLAAAEASRGIVGDRGGAGRSPGAVGAGGADAPADAEV
jgi:hypothetical protein